jgi:hypothetical protein
MKQKKTLRPGGGFCIERLKTLLEIYRFHGIIAENADKRPL